MSDHKKHKKKHKHKDRYSEVDSKRGHKPYKRKHEEISRDRRRSPPATVYPTSSQQGRKDRHPEPDSIHYYHNESSQFQQKSKRSETECDILERDNSDDHCRSRHDEPVRYHGHRGVHDEKPIRDEKGTPRYAPSTRNDTSSDYEFQWELHRNTLNKIFFTEDDYIKR